MNAHTALRWTPLFAAAALLGACQSTPKPDPTTEKPPEAGTPVAGGSAAAAGAVQPVRRPDSVTGAPLPGTEQDFVINVSDRVLFDIDQYEVREDAADILERQATWLNRYPAVQVRIEGNADERGTREYNFALGARRANSVRDYLVSKGVAGSRIETVSYGKEKPIDGGTTEEAWAKNRNAHTALTAGAPQ